MKTAAKPRVASDLMQRDLITVTPSDTLRDALALMTANHVTGLPVMDRDSQCVGMITASDILNYEQDNGVDSEEIETADVFDAETQKWEVVSLSAFALQGFGHLQVNDVMTCDLVSVERDARIEEVARRMVDEGVHRVLVMDSHKRLYGIISAFDIVRFVAKR
jgi:CBS domain-containing protein